MTEQGSDLPKSVSAEKIAEMATRGEDVAAYFTNQFVVVRPSQKAAQPATLKQRVRKRR